MRVRCGAGSVVDRGGRIVVARCRVGAAIAAEVAGAVVVEGIRVIVAGRGIRAAAILEAGRRDVGPEDKQALLDVAHNHVAGGEVGVVAPRAVELGGVAGRVHIEVGHPLELALAHVVEVEDLEAGPVVGLVDQALMGVHVVVDGRRGAHVGADQADVVQVLYVEDVGARVDRALIELVADQQVFVVLGQPALVGVGRRGVARGAEQHRVSGIGHVHDGHGILVETEGNFLARVLCIRPDVVHDLGVVAVAVLGEAADEGGGERVADVDDVQPAGEGVGPDGVGPAGLLVDGDVVAVAEAAIVRVGGEGDGGIGDIAQLGQIKHLHAVPRGF